MSTTITPASVPAARQRRFPTPALSWLEAVAAAARVGIVVVGLFFVAGIVGLGLYGHGHADRIYEGVTVAGVPVGGMTEAEARAALEQRFADVVDVPLTLEANGKTFLVTPREAGASLDSAASADQAFAFGRDGSAFARTRDWARAFIDGSDVTPVINVDLNRLDAELTAIAAEVMRPAKNAFVSMDESDSPTIVPEEAGIAFDLATTRARVLDRFGEFSTAPVVLVTPPHVPAVTADSLAESLPGAQAAVSSSLVISALDRSWIISSEDLRRIVSVPIGGGSVEIEQESLESVVAGIASSIEQPSQDAGIGVADDGSLHVIPGVDSLDVDEGATVAAAAAALAAGRHDVEATIGREQPAITDEMARIGVAEAEALISDGLKITWKDGEAQLGRDDLLAALTIEQRPGKSDPFVFGFDVDLLGVVLQPVIDQINVPVQDAKFRLVNGKITLAAGSKSGRAVDFATSSEAVVSALIDGDPEARLKVDVVKPTYTGEDRSDIKLPDVLADSWTYYGNSSEPRRNNVELAVDRETGWLIPPNGVFSYIEFIGDVSKEGGFDTGFGIVANETGGVTTAPVVGGGICQVSTTIFQAAFWAGLTIEERWQHPYWLTSYGQPPRGMKGLDAMVNIEEDWSLDMKFRNTTGNWIAVVVVADSENVTAQILGTDPGWSVEVEQPVVTNVVPLDTQMHYTESPELESGQEMQVETAQEGFDTSIHRVVKKDGEIIDEMVLTSTFAPSRNTTLRGTGGAQ